MQKRDRKKNKRARPLEGRDATPMVINNHHHSWREHYVCRRTVTIASGGVLPNIHSVLLPKKSKA